MVFADLLINAKWEPWRECYAGSRRIIEGNVNTHTHTFTQQSNETIQKQRTRGRLISCQILAFP